MEVQAQLSRVISGLGARLVLLLPLPLGCGIATAEVPREPSPVITFIKEVDTICGVTPPGSEGPYLEPLLEANTITFNALAAQQCLDWLKGFGCPNGGTIQLGGHLSGHQFPASCRESLQGHLDVGMTCSVTVACVPEAYCWSGLCVAYSPPGEPCLDRLTCKPGVASIPVCGQQGGVSYCATATGVLPKAVLGGACGITETEQTYTFRACEQGLFCSNPAHICSAPQLPR